MFGSRSLQLDERRQASRRCFEAWILTSQFVRVSFGAHSPVGLLISYPGILDDCEKFTNAHFKKLENHSSNLPEVGGVTVANRVAARTEIRKCGKKYQEVGIWTVE
ncbi:hypothetical protein TNCV_1549281 [Trichonephila clavipes]|nr:hypothetical protein TNCV_1549281 [Trichonephila clavipes]